MGFANAALGLFTRIPEIGQRSYTPYRGHMYEYFVQDSWKATQKLRLELGMRHTFIQPYYSLWSNMDVFDPSFYDPSKAVVQDPKTGYILSGDPYNGIVIPGSGWTDAAKGRIPFADHGRVRPPLPRRFEVVLQDAHVGHPAPHRRGLRV